MKNTNPGRVLWVERAQVISMLLVVLHHCVPHGYDGPAWLYALLEAIQYPALVCFFLASGLFAPRWRDKGYGAYMKKRALRLLTPYFCVNLLMLAPRYVAALMMGVRANVTVGWVLTSFIDPHGQGIAPHLWFLMTLFIMGALLPGLDALLRSRVSRAITLAALLVLSALPFRLPTLLCLNELKLYLGWYALGYALAVTRGTGAPLKGPTGLALGSAGLIVFALSLCFPALPVAVFMQMLGAAALVALAGASEEGDPLTLLFRGRTYCVYILSMCVQNLVEVAGYSARLPWYATFLAMLAAGLAVPLAVCRWNEKRPLPRWLRLVVGL